ncbi:hypothetical protein [Brevibacterium yomogidense]|uniref:hypothetical protein n=1 Tax=Brevibacterium yomogidense TaxID=946573 RepID=UPI0018DFD76E|nr:hypothetical protein [Brevibacterium yomogidense]
MDTAYQFASLADATQEFAIPHENDAVIREVTTHVGIAAYRPARTFITAERAGDGPDLHIAYGWTNGFTDEDEARSALGDLASEDAPPWQSESRIGLWGITHPVSSGYKSHSHETRTVERQRRICDTCFTEVPETRGCSNCED